MSIKLTYKKEHGRVTLLHNNTDIGSISLAEPNYNSSEKQAANRMFPDVVDEYETVSRIHGVYIDDKYRGYGLGQLIYLLGFDVIGADWYYNSQTEPDATNTLKVLHSKGYIDLYWYKGRTPNWNRDGSIHLARITDKGRTAYKSGSMIKKAFSNIS